MGIEEVGSVAADGDIRCLEVDDGDECTMVHHTHFVLITNPEFSLVIGTKALRIRADNYLLYFFKGVKINDGHRGVMAVRDVSAGIDDVETVVEYAEFIGLMTDLHFPCDLHGEGVDLKDRTQHIGVSYRTDVGTDVGLIIMECQVTAIRDIDLGDATRLQVHDLQFMGTVDDGIEFSSICLHIIAYVTEFLDLMRILGTVPVGIVITRFEVHVIESGFVRPHVSFAEHV